MNATKLGRVARDTCTANYRGCRARDVLASVILYMIPWCGFAAVGPSVAQSAEPYVYMVEEEWELTVTEPKPLIHSPQLTFYLTPDKNQAGTYFQLQINHAAREGFTGGGFMVTAICDDNAYDEARSDFRDPLSAEGEQLRWTSVMAVIDGDLLFAIKDGQGTQWGSFGGPEYILRMPAGSINSLKNYSPEHSAESTDIGFGANRVQSLVLKKSRKHYSDGNIVECIVNTSL
jgi:hypothetical protein